MNEIEGNLDASSFANSTNSNLDRNLADSILYNDQSVSSPKCQSFDEDNQFQFCTNATHRSGDGDSNMRRVYLNNRDQILSIEEIDRILQELNDESVSIQRYLGEKPAINAQLTTEKSRATLRGPKLVPIENDQKIDLKMHELLEYYNDTVYSHQMKWQCAVVIVDNEHNTVAKCRARMGRRCESMEWELERTNGSYTGKIFRINVQDIESIICFNEEEAWRHWRLGRMFPFCVNLASIGTSIVFASDTSTERDNWLRALSLRSTFCIS